MQSGIYNSPVGYSTALSDLRLLLASLGLDLDPSKYGEHSGRRGGATAASDAGVDWTDLMSHGCWKSIATPLGYLANSRRRQRRVAQALSKSVTFAPGSLDLASSSPVDVLARIAPVISSSPMPNAPITKKRVLPRGKISLPVTPVLSPVRLVPSAAPGPVSTLARKMTVPSASTHSPPARTSPPSKRFVRL